MASSIWRMTARTSTTDRLIFPPRAGGMPNDRPKWLYHWQRKCAQSIFVRGVNCCLETRFLQPQPFFFWLYPHRPITPISNTI